jgi:hypothetical protein
MTALELGERETAPLGRVEVAVQAVAALMGSSSGTSDGAARPRSFAVTASTRNANASRPC